MIISDPFDKSHAVEARSRYGEQRELEVGYSEDAPGLTLTSYSALAGVDPRLISELAPVSGVLRGETFEWSDAKVAGSLIAKHNIWVCFSPDDIPEAVAKEQGTDYMTFQAAPVKDLDVYDAGGKLVPFLVLEGEDGVQGLYEAGRDLQVYVALPEPNQE